MFASNLLLLRSNFRPLFLMSGVFMLILIAACSPAALTPAPAVTPSPSPTTTPIPPTERMTAEVKATGVPTDSVQSAFDLPKPTAANVAIAALANHLGVEQTLVSVISTGAKINAPIACELELDGKRAQLLLGSVHQEVVLEYKEKRYVYWVFTNSPDLLIPVRCK